MKANYISSIIFRTIAYRRCKSLARANEIFQDIRFETRSRCNGRCDFCPTSVVHETRPDIWMSEECHRKVVDELADINYQGGVNYYNSNEPLLDNRIPDFLSYLQSKKLKLKCVRILTNGTLLTPELGERLFDNGLTHLYVNDYFYDTKVSLRIGVIVKHLQKKYPDKKIGLARRSRHDILHNRAGQAPNKLIRVEIKASCTRPFLQFVITPTGNVGFCCNDVYANNPLGNVNVSGLREIWWNKAFASLKRNLLRGNRALYELCRACDHKGYIDPPEDVSIRARITWFANDRLKKQIADVGRGKSEQTD